MSCIGSSFGWLILCGDCGLIKLFNPLIGEDIRLPHLLGFPFHILMPGPDEVGNDIEEAVVSSDPTLDRDFAAILLKRGVDISCLTWRQR
ncbi:hypothetical protein C4D60_Mb01t29060 [Musa balbisiana]|uniref:KIB1-4 beta-propeller domain-containing protein n=1 Tax=Musa balbisiana TaxID=52838 RepID=A0A4S8JRI8_MUSBA|nr:hypothetical protein C4D60_Mb01t29060 [Musa balbisiana]